MATWGVPSTWPASLIGWQMTSRQPSKLGCLRVATTLPSTSANNMSSVNAEVIDHDATADAGESAGVAHAFAGRRGDAVAEVAFAAQAQAGHAGAVLDEEGGVQRAAHRRHRFHIVRVNDAR